MPARILPGLLRGRAARAYSALILASSPVAYWRCSESSGAGSLADSSGNSHTMTLNGTTTTGVAGKNSRLGSAAKFAVGSYGTVPSSAPFRIAGDLTLECWIKFDSALTNGDAVALGYCVVTGETSATNAQYQWNIQHTGSVEFAWFHEYNSGVNQSGEISVSFVATDWTHCVLRRDTTAKKYSAWVNGAKAGEQSYSSNPTGGGSTVFQFGRNPATGSTSNVDRTVDEVAVYSSALSDAEIFEHYRAGRRAA